MSKAADEIACLRAEVERLTQERDEAVAKAGAMRECAASETAKAASLRTALADERRHADALAEAAEMLDTHAVAIHDADGKCYSVSARDYARLFDALAQNRARRQG